MKELTQNEIKQIEMIILEEIHSICCINGFRYTLAGGSLLGAVRHHGFIPWDDDIDICMPRSDYEAFLSYCENHNTRFKLLSSRSKVCWHLFSKAYDPDTLIEDINNHDNDLNIGVHVDIFPIDGLADSEILSKIRFLETALPRELLVAKNWTKYYRSKTRSIKYELIRFPMFILSRFIPANPLKHLVEKRYKRIPFDKKKFVAIVPSSYRLKEIVPREVFTDYIDFPFESYTFKGIKEYDYYLSKIYGSYMKLPPEDKRNTHHSFIAYSKNDSE